MPASGPARPSSSTYPCAAERTREVGVSSITRATCSQRKANQPPPITAAPRFRTQNQKSDKSAKELAQVHVAALLLGELEQRGQLEVEQAGDDEVREGLHAGCC